MNNVDETTEKKENAKGKGILGKSKLSDNLLVLYLFVIVIIFLGQIVGSLLQFIPFMVSTDFSKIVTMYLIFIGVWIVAILYIRFTKKNRPILKVIGKSAAGNNWINFLIGIAMGFGLNGICVLVAWLHKDIVLYYDSFQPIYFIIIFLAVFVQSSAEEFICRGFLYQRLLRSYKSPVVAIIGNSLLFAILHLFNEGVTALSVLNIFVVGILFSFMIYYMDSMWCAMVVHTAWNFTQNIIFGLPNSGMVSPYSIFRLDAATANNSFAYNVGFGIEGTLLADVVLLLACIGMYLWGRKYGKKPYDVWK